MDDFQSIQRLADYLDAVGIEDDLVEPEFINEVICEKIKSIALQTDNPIVSLFAAYQLKSNSNFQPEASFYSEVVATELGSTSTYNQFLLSELPQSNIEESNLNYTKWVLLLLALIIISGLAFFYLKPKKSSKLDSLSNQETKIFHLLQKGLSNKEISAECNIELSTVKSHVSAIYSKLDVKSRKEVLLLKT